jgi:hypothetical protein
MANFHHSIDTKNTLNLQTSKRIIKTTLTSNIVCTQNRLAGDNWKEIQHALCHDIGTPVDDSAHTETFSSGSISS